MKLLRVIASCVFLCAAVPQMARAGFIGVYSLDQFSVNSVNGPGSVLSPDNGSSIVITGPNNGSGLSGYIDVMTTITGSGILQFQYTYSSLDDAGYDYAGYFIGGSYVPLADANGQSSTILASVNAGDLFGFRVGTVDNTGEPGILTIMGFLAPAGSGSGAGTGGVVTPEPGSLVLVLTGMMAAGLVRSQWKRRIT